MSVVKEKIYTIPVNDAFAADSRCPLCTLYQGLEQQLLEYYLGPSLMEPDTRIRTNDKGFCGDHLRKLYDSQKNRLGLGLMLHTHLGDVTEDLDRTIPVKHPGRRGLFGRGGDSPLKRAADHVRARAEACIICDHIGDTMEHYIEVIMWQSVHEADFAEKFDHCRGFCLEHLADLLEGSDRYLKGDEQVAFVRRLWKLEKDLLETLVGDVEWFTKKFDYRNEDKPWGNSKDALPRAIDRLTGLRPDPSSESSS